MKWRASNAKAYKAWCAAYRARILRRDGWRCRAVLDPALLALAGMEDSGPRRRCKRRSRLEVHHIVNRSQGGGDTDDNLLTLCDHHHDQATRRRPVFYEAEDGAIELAWRRPEAAAGR